MSFGPEIETVEDWNDRLDACGCCEMPVCPVPLIELECKFVSESDSYFWPYKVTGAAGDPVTLYETYGTASFARQDNGQFWRFDPFLTTYSGPPPGQDTRCVWSRTYISGGGYMRDNSTRNAFKNDGDPDWTITQSIDSTTVTGSGPVDLAATFGLLVQVRSAGFRCDLTTENLAVYSGGRWECADHTDAPTAGPGDPPWADGAEVTSSLGVWREDNGTNHNLSDAISLAGVIAQINAALASESWASCTSSVGAGVKKTWPTVADYEAEHGSADPCPPPTGETISAAYAKRLQRLRWEIPDNFTGSYFKITWDEVYFPDRDAIYAFPALDDSDGELVTDGRSWEWTGPGDPMDPDSWRSPWFELPDLPSGKEEGGIFVRNIRFECYRSPYGSKPQATGTPWTAPT